MARLPDGGDPAHRRRQAEPDCSHTQIGREFLNIAYRLKGGLPYQPWAAELVKQRKADNAKDDPNAHCMPRGALRVHTDDYYKK